MSRFLVVFDRNVGRLVSLTRYDDARDANRARVDAERSRAGEREMEIVVLTSDSEATLRATHSRYFADFKGIAAGALAESPGVASGAH